MAAPDWQRAKDVFQAALTRAPEARSAFLDEACGDDRELRSDVEALLASYDESGGFMSRPAGFDTDSGAKESEAAPRLQRVGPYRILDTIAQGGMGTVYRAVRDDDAFQKTVALKLVRGGRGSDSFERRFRRERQILARLQHPNIATVLDGGTTEDGQPYLVMEHVAGRPITEFCAAKGLGTRARLELFGTVCGAVQYAHQNLVIHRDLKPANVLVDDQGVPKLLDFGIAKLLASGVDPDEAPTATMLPMMTPEYASPEQVKGEAVTTASDVYSLGVVLYELLTGQRPYTVRSDALSDIVRMVCETEPPLPSVARRTSVRGSTAWRWRGRSDLRGDLDTIVMKALRKDASRRYATVEELSGDIRRHLDGLPVRARPDTLRYRVSKFAARHAVGLAAVALVFVSLVGAVVATTRQARIAERRFQETRRLANALVYETDGLLQAVPGATKARALIVKRGLDYLDSLAAEAQDDPVLLLELSTAYVKLGDAQGIPEFLNIGDTKGALESFRKALALRQRLAVLTPEDPKVEQYVGGVLNRIGRVLRVTGDIHGALEHHREALRLARSAAETLGDTASRRRIVVAACDLCVAYLALGDTDEALRVAREGRSVGAQILAESPSDDSRNVHAAPLECEGDALAAQGDAEGAIARFAEGLKVAQELAATNPSHEAGQPLLDAANQQIKIGQQLTVLRRFPEARQRFDEAMQAAEALVARDPNDIEGRRAMAEARKGSADLLMRTDPRRALDEYEKSLASLRQVVKTDASNLRLQETMGNVLLQKSRAEQAAGFAAAAAKSLDQAEAIARTLVEKGAGIAGYQALFARVRFQQGVTHPGAKAESCPMLRDAAAVWERLARGRSLSPAAASDQAAATAAAEGCPTGTRPPSPEPSAAR